MVAIIQSVSWGIQISFLSVDQLLKIPIFSAGIHLLQSTGNSASNSLTTNTHYVYSLVQTILIVNQIVTETMITILNNVHVKKAVPQDVLVQITSVAIWLQQLQSFQQLLHQNHQF